jgi:L-fuculose-phosphate aldolase
MASAGDGPEAVTEEKRQRCLAELVEYGVRLERDGLVNGTAGNLSVRLGDEVVITPTSVRYELIEPQALCTVDLDGNKLSGGGEPSSETPLHMRVYASTEARAVVHTHSMYATTLACTVDELPAIHYAIHRFGGTSVAVAEYERFGSPELADAAVAALGSTRAVLLRNHGALVHGASLAEAYGFAGLLEWLSELYCKALACGQPRILTAEQIEHVAAEAKRLRYMREVEAS